MTLSTLESVINPFRKISVWKKATSGTYDHEVGSSRAKRSRNVETVEEALLPDVHHEFLEWRGCSREAKSRYNSRLATLLPKLIYSPQIVDWQLLHKIGCGDEVDQMLKISLKEAQSDEVIFFFVAWVRAFNIREPIYPELCREFYATYEFDEVCADDELQSKKIISFRLGGCAHSLTLLEFARRLGLYHADELKEDDFDIYFQGGLRSDENFNAREYWERISLDRDLHLSRSSITSVRFPIHITSEWVCERGLGDCKVDEKKGSWKSKGQSDLLWMFFEESDKIEKYVGGLPDMIHGSVMASRPKTMQDAIEMATELMDKKISTLAERQAENKRKLDNINQAQQQSPKRQNVAQAYAAGTGEMKEYAGTLPLCNRCKLHHNGPCTVKCENCKKVGLMTRDCRNPAAARNQRTLTCYECGDQGHYRSDCSELKNRNHENQAEGTGAHGVVHALGGGEIDQDPNNIEDETEV
ncbi:retrotransposon ORF1 [Tanacetum coccineum]|uniref:Retrotransposon ORF1 n=1 Tax=Tanacetum coccineum TaxID=301880 RepID=A0ABQ5IDR3_9ASTR